MDSPILNQQIAQAIFRDRDLRSRLLAIEGAGLIDDQSEVLSKLVNTAESRKQAISRWVRYREGYSPAIVQKILESFPIDSENEFVFDPMCGSGSTQIAAQQLGIASGGTDISPYAVLVSQVKTSGKSASEISEISSFLDRALANQLPNGTSRSETDAQIAKYFPPANFEALISLRIAINSEFTNSLGVADFLNVALLAILEEASNRKKDGNGLASRPSKITDVPKLFAEQAKMMLADLSSAKWLQIASLTQRTSALDLGESTKFASAELGKALGAIIFSPPYANSFDYYESYKLELLFGGFFTVDTIAKERSRLIRSYRQMGKTNKLEGIDTVELLIDEIMGRLPEKEAQTGSRDGRSKLLPNMLRGYFTDMKEFLVKSKSAMPTGSYMAIVVDQSAYLGVLVPTDLILAEIAEELGFKLEKLVICRRAKTSGQQLNMQPALGEVLRETAVILRR